MKAGGESSTTGLGEEGGDESIGPEDGEEGGEEEGVNGIPKDILKSSNDTGDVDQYLTEYAVYTIMNT